MREHSSVHVPVSGFARLTPEVFLAAVEEALEIRLTGLAHPLTSYINRVYELQDVEGIRRIAKFYRPGRWSLDAIREEHRFVGQCAGEEIPVAAPLVLSDGGTIGFARGVPFAVYEKRLGRELEPVCSEDWRRLGRVIGRLHVVGAAEAAPSRVRMHPGALTAECLDQLCAGGFVGHRHEKEFRQLAGEIIRAISPVFDDVEMIRIHGDCHRGNLLERPGEGILVIDFDDMATGPPIQDLWMLLPGHAHDSRREINLILEGYEDFRDFDDRSIRLIEPLRIMRILYFLAWCSRQRGDPHFTRNFPDWGTDVFWGKEIADLRQQFQLIQKHC